MPLLLTINPEVQPHHYYFVSTIMRILLYLLGLCIVLPLFYLVISFVIAKGDCENRVLDAARALPSDPGSAAKRMAAHEAALASPECRRVINFATFAQMLLRGE